MRLTKILSVGLLLCMALLGLPSTQPASAQGPGLGTPTVTVVSQDSPGVPGTAEAKDRTGAAITTGDFDGDGVADLVIGSPGESLGPALYTGMVSIVYGDAGRTPQSFHQDTPGIPGSNEIITRAPWVYPPRKGDVFGSAVAAGDFNGDGFDDLAIGAPGEGLGAGDMGRDGMVTVIYGSASGLTTAGATALHQASPGVPGSNEDLDDFGASLAVGDFNNDGMADLVVGSPGEGIGTIDEAGALAILFGSSSGLTGIGSQSFHQGTAGVVGANEPRDLFASSLAVGDFNGDGNDDIAVGSPREDIGGTITNSGMVTVLFGTGSGVTGFGSQAIHQGTPGVPGANEPFDQFGSAVAAGDFDGDGIDDLAVAARTETLGQAAETGMVTVVPGTPSGLTGTGSVALNRATPGIPGTNERFHEFGSGLATNDVNNDGFDDLAIGTTGTSVYRGSVYFVAGSASGIDPTQAQEHRWVDVGTHNNQGCFGKAIVAMPAGFAVGQPGCPNQYYTQSVVVVFDW